MMDFYFYQAYHKSVDRLWQKEIKIMTNQHLKALQYRHNELEKVIVNENKRPLPNFLKLKELKIQKLVLKQELALFTS